MTTQEILDGLKQAVIDGDEDSAASFAAQAIDAEIKPMDIIKGQSIPQWMSLAKHLKTAMPIS